MFFQASLMSEVDILKFVSDLYCNSLVDSGRTK